MQSLHPCCGATLQCGRKMCVLGMLSIEEENSDLDLVDAAFQYITEKYPVKCRETRKRAIRKEAGMFIVRVGVKFVKKKKQRAVSMQIRLMG